MDHYVAIARSINIRGPYTPKRMALFSPIEIQTLIYRLWGILTFSPILTLNGVALPLQLSLAPNISTSP